MKRYRARYTMEAAAKIRKLHPQIKREIRAAVQRLLDAPLAGYSLHFELSGLWSYRVRNHRIIYRINENESMLDIVFVGPRRDIYEELRDLLIGTHRTE